MFCGCKCKSGATKKHHFNITLLLSATSGIEIIYFGSSPCLVACLFLFYSVRKDSFMKTIFIKTVVTVGLIALPVVLNAQAIYSISSDNQVYVAANADAAAQGPYNVYGMHGTQILTAINMAPDGTLYALGYDYASGLGQLYYVNNMNSGYSVDPVGDAAPGLNLTQDNAISSFAFIPALTNAIKLTDEHNNSYIINSDDGTIVSIGNELVNEQTGNIPGTNNDLIIYPNPVTSNARILLPAAATSNVFVDVIDMNGRVMRSFEFGKGTFQLDMDMSALPIGLYSVRVAQAGMPLENLKVVKN